MPKITTKKMYEDIMEMLNPEGSDEVGLFSGPLNKSTERIRSHIKDYFEEYIEPTLDEQSYEEKKFNETLDRVIDKYNAERNRPNPQSRKEAAIRFFKDLFNSFTGRGAKAEIKKLIKYSKDVLKKQEASKEAESKFFLEYKTFADKQVSKGTYDTKQAKIDRKRAVNNCKKKLSKFGKKRFDVLVAERNLKVLKAKKTMENLEGNLQKTKDAAIDLSGSIVEKDSQFGLSVYEDKLPSPPKITLEQNKQELESCINRLKELHEEKLISESQYNEMQKKITSTEKLHENYVKKKKDPKNYISIEAIKKARNIGAAISHSDVTSKSGHVRKGENGRGQTRR